ncbi:c-type cytochrome [Campylobacter sp. MG1]|uniref:c-type cytochrome n=1 Tax=Campylobacter sp. MG1 TaxID=2976332 RepID=UPI00226D3C68|nr:c-type cytochrome [Campylobacter sp. MG1]
MKKILIFLAFTSMAFSIDMDALLNYNINSENVDEKLGETLYIKTYKCAACHGAKGEKASGTFSALDSKTASYLKSSLLKYQNDRDYGGKTRFVMQRYAKRLSHAEMDNIIAYIKGSDNLELPNSKNAEPAKKTQDGLFIE